MTYLAIVFYEDYTVDPHSAIPFEFPDLPGCSGIAEFSESVETVAKDVLTEYCIMSHAREYVMPVPSTEHDLSALLKSVQLNAPSTRLMPITIDPSNLIQHA